MRRENPGLSLKAVDRAEHQRLALEKRGVVGEEARREVIRTIDDDVITRGDLHRVVRREADAVRLDDDMRVHLAQAGDRAVEFGFPDP